MQEYEDFPKLARLHCQYFKNIHKQGMAQHASVKFIHFLLDYLLCECECAGGEDVGGGVNAKSLGP